MPTIKNMTDEEVDDYVRHFRSTASALSSALAMFHFRALNGATPLERAEAAKQAIIYRRHLDLLEMQFTAVTRRNGAVRPPTKAEVGVAIKRAEDLAKVNAASAKLDTFMTIAQAAIDAFAQLHPGAAPVSTSPHAAKAIAALEKVQLKMVA